MIVYSHSILFSLPLLLAHKTLLAELVCSTLVCIKSRDFVRINENDNETRIVNHVNFFSMFLHTLFKYVLLRFLQVRMSGGK